MTQFSMALAGEAVAEVAAWPVFTTPDAAVTKLRRLLARGGDA